MAQCSSRPESNDGGRFSTGDAPLDLQRPALSIAPLVIALVGLVLEARIAAAPDVLVICHQRGGKLSDADDSAIRAGCRSIISFGIAGALAPGLSAGDLIVASAVIDGPTVRPTDAAWSGRLLQTIPGSTVSGAAQSRRSVARMRALNAIRTTSKRYQTRMPAIVTAMSVSTRLKDVALVVPAMVVAIVFRLDLGGWSPSARS
jgi:Phosphorylase superfamily